MAELHHILPTDERKKLKTVAFVQLTTVLWWGLSVTARVEYAMLSYTYMYMYSVPYQNKLGKHNLIHVPLFLIQSRYFHHYY